MKYVAIERVRRDDALDCLAILQHRIHFRFKLPHHRGQAACRGSVRRNRTPFHFHLKFETPVISRRLRPHPRRKHRRSRHACESDFASGHSAERQWNLRRANGRGGLQKWRSHRRNDRRLELLRRSLAQQISMADTKSRNCPLAAAIPFTRSHSMVR